MAGGGGIQGCDGGFGMLGRCHFINPPRCGFHCAPGVGGCQEEAEKKLQAMKKLRATSYGLRARREEASSHKLQAASSEPSISIFSSACAAAGGRRARQCRAPTMRFCARVLLGGSGYERSSWPGRWDRWDEWDRWDTRANHA